VGATDTGDQGGREAPALERLEFWLRRSRSRCRHVVPATRQLCFDSVAYDSADWLSAEYLPDGWVARVGFGANVADYVGWQCFWLRHNDIIMT